VAKHYTRQRSTRERIVANRAIRFPQVRVIGDKGEQVGLMSTEEALEKARIAEKDLVLVTEKAQPPVVKIIELSKFKYQLQQKQAENRKSARQQDIKGVRLKPFMGEADFQTRIRQIERFLKTGDKVRIEVDFRGRAQTKKEFGYRQFEQIIEVVQEIAEVEIPAKAIGNKLMMQLTPGKKAK
jgi:translation initiation factor IF-3